MFRLANQHHLFSQTHILTGLHPHLELHPHPGPPVPKRACGTMHSIQDHEEPRSAQSSSPRGLFTLSGQHRQLSQRYLQVSTACNTTMVQATDSYRVQTGKERTKGCSWFTLASLRPTCQGSLLAQVEKTLFVYDEMQWPPRRRIMLSLPTRCGSDLQT